MQCFAGTDRCSVSLALNTFCVQGMRSRYRGAFQLNQTNESKMYSINMFVNA